MKMKDKLFKNHHKGIYYLLRNAAFSTILIASATSLVAIPTYISLKAREEPTIAKEEPTKLENSEEVKTLAFY